MVTLGEFKKTFRDFTSYSQELETVGKKINELLLAESELSSSRLRAKQKLMDILVTCDDGTFQMGTQQVSLISGPRRVVILDRDSLPDEYKSYGRTVHVKYEQLESTINAGHDIPGVTLEQEHMLLIKECLGGAA